MYKLPETNLHNEAKLRAAWSNYTAWLAVSPIAEDSITLFCSYGIACMAADGQPLFEFGILLVQHRLSSVVYVPGCRIQFSRICQTVDCPGASYGYDHVERRHVA